MSFARLILVSLSSSRVLFIISFKVDAVAEVRVDGARLDYALVLVDSDM